MSASPILVLHISGGVLALFSGAAAMSLRKGSDRHRLAGRVFGISMFAMAAGAVYLGFVRHQIGNALGGLFTLYLVGTAWLTARRRDGETSRFDWLALLIPLTLGVLSWTNGLKILRSGASSQDGAPVGMIFFLGSVQLLAAAGDVSMLVRGGVSGTQRLVRHLWRMCFGLFVASGSFFLGPANRPLRLLRLVGLSPSVFQPLFSMKIYLFLTMLPLLLLIFWTLRVRFTNAYKRKPSEWRPRLSTKEMLEREEKAALSK